MPKRPPHTVPPAVTTLLTLPQRAALRAVRGGVLDASGAPFLSDATALTYALSLAASVVMAGQHAGFMATPLPPPTDADLVAFAAAATAPRRKHRAKPPASPAPHGSQ